MPEIKNQKEKFKEAAEAYEVLGDPGKGNNAMTQCGHEGLRGNKLS